MDYPVLESLQGTADLQALTAEQKARLAEELRSLIIETVSKNGGHLAANLGVIELTIALLAAGHYPQDSIIFDVGHQSYAWKILTDRRDTFSTIRLKGGLSGFPKRQESVYDSFNTGHSSTSISAALGIARAKRAKGNLSKTIALIGDGSLGGGMALEAMSDAGQSGENLLVVLNDNTMCIDRAVGGIARHLESLRISQRYIRLKTAWEARLLKIPLMGLILVQMIARSKRRWRSWGRESGAIFEQLGFRYYGPVDGHNVADLERHLRALRLVRGPVLLHVVTVKGKGYCYAENEPEVFHGVPSFDLDNGHIPENGEQDKTFSELFGEILVELARHDKEIVAVTAAMAQGTGLVPFSHSFPERFFDVGIAEQHALTMAAGMAAGGLRPYVALYSTFLQRAVDQLIHDVCLQNLPLVLVVDRAGLVGGDGETHQGLYDLAIALPLPNLTVLAPASAADLRASLIGARHHDGPVLIRYPHDLAGKRDYGCYPSDPDQIELSHLQTLRQVAAGSDLTVVALGTSIREAERAVEDLKASDPGFSVDLFSCICASPFDYESMLKSIHKTGRLLLIEEGIENGGFGSCISAKAVTQVPGLLVNYAGVSTPTALQATRQELMVQVSLDAESLEERMRQMLQER
ncbi:MAG TPA: 1-deoxy-D-xylulose-5-phosphate synthase [Bacillota bacterium]|jgi:1-deoxy-D-xylulose-5-phosphate synthase|nr:1-deoxy-D-xylulose-5-phosphate synthase [Bacillota bacterium]HQB80766.1 1-deoxy-D-xylulose-5-phosphate synthase [Bacillota bacterium]